MTITAHIALDDRFLLPPNSLKVISPSPAIWLRSQDTGLRLFHLKPIRISMLGGIMRRSATLVLITLLAVFAMPVSSTWAKTAKECNTEWKANKPALQAAKQKKKDFMNACKAGTESIPAAAPAPAPAPTARTTPPRQRSAPAPQRSAPPASSSRAAPTNAGQFTSEAQAKGRCPSDTVVWVNTRSGVYHYAGTHNYGTTKSGVYMCEGDTANAGYRPAKNEHHP